MTQHIQPVLNNLAHRGYEFAQEHLKDLPNVAAMHFPHFIKGATYAVTGLVSNLKPHTDMNQRYWTFIKEAYLPVLGTLYGVFAIFAFFFFPVTVALIFLAPAILWQLLTTISVWGLHIAQKR